LHCSNAELILHIITVYAQVKTGDGANMGPVLKLQPVPEDVHDLRKVVKDEMKPELNYCAAHRLRVFPPDTVDFDGEGIEEKFDGGDDRAHPLIVVVPKKDSGQNQMAPTNSLS
jgi:hypothetical protein